MRTRARAATPSSVPPTLPASAARSSSLVTSSSTICTSGVGSRRAVRSVRLIARPNEVSTTSAPCSCASRAVENAIDASLSTPVTRMRLPCSSIGVPRRSGSERADSERRVGVAPRPAACRAWCASTSSASASTRRVSAGCDHRVDVAALGGDVRVGERAPRTRLRARAARSSAFGLVGDRGQRTSVQDLHRAGRAHHRDLGGRPRHAPVVAEVLASPSRCTRRRTPCAARRRGAARWPPRTRARARRRGGSCPATRGRGPARSRACRRT